MKKDTKEKTQKILNFFIELFTSMFVYCICLATLGHTIFTFSVLYWESGGMQYWFNTLFGLFITYSLLLIAIMNSIENVVNRHKKELRGEKK